MELRIFPYVTVRSASISAPLFIYAFLHRFVQKMQDVC